MLKELLNCDHHGRMKGDARREQILRTAVELFSQKGFKGTTTKEIAKAAGVSEAMVFRHFDSKDDLYQAILDTKGKPDEERSFPWEHDAALKKAVEDKDDFGVFYNLALHALNKQESDVCFMRLMFYSALEEHVLAERFFREFVEKVYDFFSNYIEQRHKDGAFRKVPARLAVRAFMGMYIHHSLNNLIWDKHHRLMDVTKEEAAKAFADIFLKGVLIRPENEVFPVK